MSTRTNFCMCVFLHLFYVLLTVQAQDSASESTTKFEFDCRRSSVSCGSGNECNLTSGSCVCNNNEKDYICGQSGTDCPEDKYGNDCDFNRVQVVCSLTGMLVNVNPHGRFQGVISVYSKSEVDACTFVNISNLNVSEDLYQPNDYKQWEGYGIDINHTSDLCGNATYSAAGQEVSYTRTFIVRYSQYFFSAIDQIITAKCTSHTDNVTVFGSIPSVINQEQLCIKNITVDDEVDAVTFKIAKENGTPLTKGSPVVLGDKLELRFEGVQGFRLNKCVANNTINKTADFVTDNCPDEKAKSLFYDNIFTFEGNGKFQIILRLRAFRFTGNSAVAFVCNVTLCGQTCPKLNCPGYSPAVTTPAPNAAPAASVINSSNSSEVSNTTESPKTDAESSNSSSSGIRRKRDVENSKILSTSLQVLDSRDQLPADTTSISSKAESSECQEDRSLLVLVILLAVFVVILLGCIGVLVSRTLNKKSAAAKTHRMDTRYAEPVPTMRLPRLELNTTSVNQPC